MSPYIITEYNNKCKMVNVNTLPTFTIKVKKICADKKIFWTDKTNLPVWPNDSQILWQFGTDCTSSSYYTTILFLQILGGLGLLSCFAAVGSNLVGFCFVLIFYLWMEAQISFKPWHCSLLQRLVVLTACSLYFVIISILLKYWNIWVFLACFSDKSRFLWPI